MSEKRLSHCQGKGSLTHNNRKFNAKNVDDTRTKNNIIFTQQPIEEAYERLFGTEPKVRAIHAGLECGLFLEKYPELEMVSFGPTLRGVHSPDERLEIATVPKFWDLLLEVLKTV